jgi:hypothetical protein
MQRGCFALLLTTFLCGQAQALTCHLEVGGVVFADGACQYEEDTDGSFRFFDDSDPRMFAYVTMNEDETALGYWPGPQGGTHAHDNLGTLRRDGACWRNASARVCAWR